MKEVLNPSPCNNSQAISDSESFLHETDQDARFNSSLLELKELRSQLHYAASYCEVSFCKSEDKKNMVENTKEYICRALVTVVDHLGTVSTNLEDQLSNNQEFADTEIRMSCLKQRLRTCQEYTQRLALSNLCWGESFPRHHTRYISLQTPDLENSNVVLREVDNSLVPKPIPKHNLDQGKKMPLFLYTHAHKLSLIRLPVADISSDKKLNVDSSSGLKFPLVLPVRDPFVISIPRNPSFHFQEKKKLGRNEQNRRLLQLPWRKSYRMQ